jgi:hypothetical protein
MSGCKTFAIAGALAALAAAPAAAAPVLWGDNGHYYEYVGGGFSFDAALAGAAAMTFGAYEGYLATITSEAENAFIASLVVAGAGQATQTWVGGSDRETEGVWKWITGPEEGTVFWNGGEVAGQYHNWNRPQEPNDFGGEDGLSAYYFENLLWNDLSGGAGSGYVVEYRLAPTGGVPEPATWAMLILGFAATGALLRRKGRAAFA